MNWSGTITLPGMLLLGLVLIVAILVEFKTTKIKNWLTYPAALGGILLSVHDGLWIEHIVGFVVSFMLALTLGSTVGCGTGLIKLQAAVGAIVGPLAGVLNSALFLVGTALFEVHDRFFPPPEIEIENRTAVRRSIPGSLAIIPGTVAAAILLWRPWS